MGEDPGDGAGERGGAYAIVDEGQREVEQDRKALANPTRWVIEDDEPNDTYIAAMREKRAGPNDETAIKGLLRAMKWELCQTDAGAIRVDLTIGGEVLDKRAGEAGGEGRGRRNVAVLLKRCRQVFADAWDEMSVVDYLVQNFGGDPAKLDQLAEQLFYSSGTLLSLNTQDSPLKTIFMRAYRGADLRQDTVLAALYEGVSRREGILGKMAHRRHGDERLLNPGHQSQDRFKLTFITMSDLIKPEDCAAYVAGRDAYRAISQSEQWLELHIFPAETNALRLERELGSLRPPQRRREMAVDVVSLLDDEDLFRLVMRCLVYGEGDYLWMTQSGAILGDRGLLLHEYTNPDRKANGNGRRVWRVTAQPAGERHRSGDSYDPMGNLALPAAYDLTAPAEEPDLLQALVQLTVVKKTARNNESINVRRVEDTLNDAMARHEEICQRRSPRGWTLLEKHAGDPALEREAASTAAQIIRLAAFMAKADGELARHEWAWRPDRTDFAPADWGLVQIARAQAHVDLWSALKLVADWEMRKLQVRFRELADWVAGIPDDIIVTKHVGTEEVAGIDSNLDVSGGSAYGSVDVGATGSPSQPEAGE